ncbi:MAG: hypothetical protein ACYC6P_03325 [Ignavibacteriaceae bacterium]
MKYIQFLIFSLLITFIFFGCKKSSSNPVSSGSYLVNDYFPLKVGNNWTFNYDLVSRSSSYNNYESIGILNWEITSSKSSSDFEIRSILNATRHYFNTGNDSIMVPDTISFDVTETADGIVNFDDSHLMVDQISFNRFNQVFSDSGSVYLSTPINSDAVILSLKKNIGISEFTMDHSHNSAPSGNVTLINYTVLSN